LDRYRLFSSIAIIKQVKAKTSNIRKKGAQSADSVLVVSETMKENYNKLNSNIQVITNGFDRNTSQKKVDLDNKFTITHIGLMNADRNPIILWKVLHELVNGDMEFASDLQIKLIGKSANEVYDSIRQSKIENNAQFIGYLPHQKVMDHQRSSQVLLLAVNNVPSAKGIITGKIFEYLQAKRPILAIGPVDGDLAAIIENTNSGIVIDFKDEENLKKNILELYQKFKQGNLNIESKNIEKYYSKNLTKKLVEVINSLG